MIQYFELKYYIETGRSLGSIFDVTSIQLEIQLEYIGFLVASIFSKHRLSGPMHSISRFVHMRVCLCVCSLLRYRLNAFLSPLPEIICPKLLEIQNPWGREMVSDLNIFV